jgi:hypothetical protein
MLSHGKLIIESEVDKYFKTWCVKQYCKVGRSGPQSNDGCGEADFGVQ